MKAKALALVKQLPMRLRNKMGKTGVVLSKHSPAIFTGVGIAMMTGATVVAFNNAGKVEKAIDWYNNNQKLLEANGDDEIPFYDEGAMEQSEANKNLLKTMAKELLPVIGLQVGGAAFVVAGARINTKRIKTLGAIAASTAAEFAAYRGRVVEDQGEEADQRYMRGEVETTQTVQHVTPKGRVKEKEETVKIPNPEQHTEWAFQIRYGDGCWAQNPEYLAFNLKNFEEEMNRKLHRQGYLFLNQVYDILGAVDLVEKKGLDGRVHQDYVPRYTQEGQLVGWIDDGTEKDQVSLGIDWEAVSQHLPWGPIEVDADGVVAGMWLEPNVQGVIIDKI